MSDKKNSIYIGIDGGGTGCRVAITDGHGQHLGKSLGGPANPTFQPKIAVTNILEAIDAARVDAGLDMDSLKSARAFLGLAGIRNAKIADHIAAALPVKQARVVEDRITTVTGALAGGDGAVAAIGTGSFLAQTTLGKTTYVGGWGFRLGDQASGAWLGHQLMRHVALCIEDIAPHTALTRTALAHFNGDTDQFFDFANTATPGDLGQFAPQIAKSAQEGDTTAKTLMQEGADYIAKSLKFLNYHPNQPLCLTGGLGPHYANFLPDNLTTNVIKPKGTALDGAVALALQMGPPA